jgi:hypothetical protein
MMKLGVSAVGLFLLSSASVMAQTNPGDDYIRTCTNSPTYETVNIYSGLAQCQAQFYSGGILYTTWLTELVPSSQFPTRRIYGFVPGGIASCVANVPFFQTVTRQTGTQQQCTSVPQQPFTQLQAVDTACVAGATTYYLTWPSQPGDGYVLEWKVAGDPSFVPYWGGHYPGATVNVWGVGTQLVFRLRTMRSGTSGSWSYVSVHGRCSTDISD